MLAAFTAWLCCTGTSYKEHSASLESQLAMLRKQLGNSKASSTIDSSVPPLVNKEASLVSTEAKPVVDADKDPALHCEAQLLGAHRIVLTLDAVETVADVVMAGQNIAPLTDTGMREFACLLIILCSATMLGAEPDAICAFCG